MLSIDVDGKIRDGSYLPACLPKIRTVPYFPDSAMREAVEELGDERLVFDAAVLGLLFDGF